MFKTYQFAPDIAVMIISEFEPHSRFQCMLKDMPAQSNAYAQLTSPIDFVLAGN